MKKGQKKRIWTKEQKLEIIEKHLKEHISVRTIEKEYNVDRSLVCNSILYVINRLYHSILFE
jgi:transposase-like protein